MGKKDTDQIILKNKRAWMMTQATPWQRVQSINRRYSKLLSALQIDINDEAVREQILKSPCLGTIKRIFLAADNSRYAIHYFSQMCDKFFLRYADSMGDDVPPGKIRWQDSGCLPLPEKWIPYVTIGYEEESVGLEWVEETVMRKVKYHRVDNPHVWDVKEEPVIRQKRVEKFRKWPVFALKSGWWEECQRYYLNEREAEIYKGLQAACDVLNKVFCGSVKASYLPAYLKYNPLTGLIEPTDLCDSQTFNF